MWCNTKARVKSLTMEESKQEPKEIVKPLESFRKKEWAKIDKDIASALFLAHLLCIFAPFHFTWGAFWVAFALYVITGLGISVSYHRHLAHRSFNLPKWLEYLFAYCGAHALQGDPIDWVSTHRCHHRFVDTKKDPHSPIQGFWFSHITWVLDSNVLTKKVCPKYLVNDFEKIERNMFMLFMKQGRPENVGDLEKQIFYRFLYKTYFLHPILLAVVLYAMGGLPFLIWGMAVRIIVVLHITFMVNSVCHIWGKRPWKTNDLSTNNWWVGLLSFGEGWHNNHHAFEYSARHGLEWWEIDFGWYVIMFLEAIGVATHVKVPSQTHKDKLAMDEKKFI